MAQANYVGALDQGTTSNRFIIFDHGGNIVGLDQKEHEQIFPQPGWVEIWPPSGSPTSGKPLLSGIKIRVSLFPTPLSGSARAPMKFANN
jgi:glycerol kinase